MTREEKVNFLVESIWELEGATVGAAYFEDYTDEQIDEKFDWYEYLWTK